MRTTPLGLPLRFVAVLLTTAAFGSHPGRAHHTTDHTQQQLEYERQQREYWRAQERQRDEERVRREQNERLMRQREEESRRSTQQMAPRTDWSSPRPGTSGAPTGGAAAPQARSGDALQVCKSNPLAKGERNPLLGQWRPKDMPQGDNLSQLLQMAASPQCATFALGVEFRERELVTAVAPAPAYYGHKGDDWFVCLPESRVRLLRFRVEAANQLLEVATKCRLVRGG